MSEAEDIKVRPRTADTYTLQLAHLTCDCGAQGIVTMEVTHRPNSQTTLDMHSSTRWSAHDLDCDVLTMEVEVDEWLPPWEERADG
jgi:hypothetical protein